MKIVYNPVQKQNLQLFPSGGDPIVLIDTRANVLASTPTAGKIAYSSDTKEFFVGSGSIWEKAPLKLNDESVNPDMGYQQQGTNSGLAASYITDKAINYSTMGANGNPVNGGFRVLTTGVFQMYLNGTWQTVVTNFVFREDSAFGYTLEHTPVGFTNPIEIMTGETLSNLGLNGLPLTNGYKTVMGAYGVPSQIGGRTVI